MNGKQTLAITSRLRSAVRPSFMYILRRAAITSSALLVIFSIAAITHVKLGVQASSTATSRAGRPHALQSMMGQSAYFAYWRSDSSFDSTLVMNNASSSDLTVQPTLYNLEGAALTVAEVKLPARQHVSVKISDWISASAGGSSFQQGSLILNYMSGNAADLGALLTVTDPIHSLSFDVPDEMPMSYMSSRLEGIWWLPTQRSDYSLVVSNMANTAVSMTLSGTAEAKHGGRASSGAELGPHQTRVFSLHDLAGAGLLPAAGSRNAGGITVEHQGEPGSVLAYGMASQSDIGFSSHFPFEDPAMAMSTSLSAAHILVGAPDVAGLPNGAVFSANAILGNLSDSA
ncbi:MAG: hypothetical protein ACREAC_25460, partial [Blastocatellia bacterium]